MIGVSTGFGNDGPEMMPSRDKAFLYVRRKGTTRYPLAAAHEATALGVARAGIFR